jgi:hypothetical protein
MIVSDLAYLEFVSEDSDIEGGSLFPCYSLPCLPFPRPNVNITGNIVATGNVEYFGLGIAVDPCITGHSAKAEGGASAVGNNTYTFFSPNAMVNAYAGTSMSSGIAVASAL